MKEFFFLPENYLRQYAERIFNASAEERQAAAAINGQQTSLSPIKLVIAPGEEAISNILSINNETGTISISGFLSRNGPTALQRYFDFDGTGYNEILKALSDIEASQQVKNIVLEMDTPGGEVDGVDEIFQRLFGLRDKYNITAVNRGLLASAGYYIAAAAHKIIAASPGAITGSIGVRAAWIDPSEALEKAGFKRIEILSANAPKKGGLSTTAGISAVQDELNALERIFYQRISEGRGIEDVEYLIANFGQGAAFVAQDPDTGVPDALKVGMIDEVRSQWPDSTNSLVSNIGRMSASTDDILITLGTPAYQDFDIVDIVWDSSAADKRVRKKTDSKETPSAEYKFAFFWFDGKDKERFGAYKLPFVDVSDGKLVAVKNGIYAANGAMAGARTGKPPDIPQADRKQVQAHIDKYLKKIEKIKEKETEESAMAKNLAELIEENPTLKVEVEAIKRESFEAGIKTGKTQVESRIAKVKPFIGSADYPPAVTALAVKVLAGESDPAALEGAVTVIDAQREEKAAAEAVAETGETPETVGDIDANKGQVVSSDGMVSSEADMRAAVDRMRGINIPSKKNTGDKQEDK